MSTSDLDKANRNYDMSIKILIFMTIFLIALRLASLDIMNAISDGLGILLIYFFYYGRSKCMAIFLVFNGLMGSLISFSKISQLNKIAELNGTSVDLSIMIITVYGLIVYIYEIIIGAIGINKYPWDAIFSQGMRDMRNDNNDNERGFSSNYGAIGSQSNNYQAFSGRGTTVG